MLNAMARATVPHTAAGKTSVIVRASSRQPNQPEGKKPIAISRSTLLKAGIIATGAMFAGGSPPAVAEAITASAPPAAPSIAASLPQTLSQVMLTTLSDCQLAVSAYPTFSYNAAGGGGMGAVTRQDDGTLRVSWDPAALSIPPITYSTSAVLGVPIPPPLKIAITPQKLEGTIDPETGIAQLDFLAQFEFTAGPLYSAPPLVVSTTLTTEESAGELRQGKGKRLSADGKGTLVGVARVPKTGDGFLDTFLMLPTDALAVLSADMKFS